VSLYSGRILTQSSASASRLGVQARVYGAGSGDGAVAQIADRRYGQLNHLQAVRGEQFGLFVRLNASGT
jgi:hypothetical protein